MFYGVCQLGLRKTFSVSLDFDHYYWAACVHVWPMGICVYTCNPKQGESEFQKIPKLLHGI
jgi:hypothetical protein